MASTHDILLLGAAYGSLLASKILFGGHKIHMVCLPAEADLINAEGFRVRLSVRGRKDPVVLESQKLPGKVTAGPATGIDPKDFDLVGLAMQEPQYRSPGVRELLDAVAKSRVPCMSIMNMPPLPYLARIPGIDPARCADSYTDPSVWASFDPKTGFVHFPGSQSKYTIRYDQVTKRYWALVQKINENITVRRFERVEAKGKLLDYVHPGAKVAVIVDYEGDAEVECAEVGIDA